MASSTSFIVTHADIITTFPFENAGPVSRCMFLHLDSGPGTVFGYRGAYINCGRCQFMFDASCIVHPMWKSIETRFDSTPCGEWSWVDMAKVEEWWAYMDRRRIEEKRRKLSGCEG